MGLDSLMALELRNRLEPRTGLTLSAATMWNYPTVALLAGHLAERMAVSGETEVVHGGTRSSSRVAAADAQDLLDADLSPDELEALLAEELAAIDKLLSAD
jgi:hypothetical protein